MTTTLDFLKGDVASGVAAPGGDGGLLEGPSGNLRFSDWLFRSKAASVLWLVARLWLGYEWLNAGYRSQGILHRRYRRIGHRQGWCLLWVVGRIPPQLRHSQLLVDRQAGYPERTGHRRAADLGPVHRSRRVRWNRPQPDLHVLWFGWRQPGLCHRVPLPDPRLAQRRLLRTRSVRTSCSPESLPPRNPRQGVGRGPAEGCRSGPLTHSGREEVTTPASGVVTC
jgi:hypothetical protein